MKPVLCFAFALASAAAVDTGNLTLVTFVDNGNSYSWVAENDPGRKKPA